MDPHQGFGHTGRRNIPEGELQWQVRINLSDEFAVAARANPADPKLKPVLDVLAKYDARIQNAGMSFANFLPHFVNEELPARMDELWNLAQGSNEATARMNVLEKLALDFLAADRNDDISAGKEIMDAWVAASGDVGSADWKKANADMSERMSLFLWSKATMLKPETHLKYATRFTIYAEGGKEVYKKATADGLEADMKALMATGMVTRVNKFDSDPAHNPQAPKHLRPGG